MTADEWRTKARAAAEEGAEDLALPSGMVIRARRPGPMQYAAWDRLPLLLAAVDDAGAISNDQAMEIARFLRELLVYCCLSPRIVEAPAGEDEIAPREIPDADWRHIVTWAMRVEEAAAVRPFRPERADVGGGGDGKVLRMPAVGVDGDRGPGAGAGI